MAIQVSIIICTLNHAQSLRETLASLAAVAVPASTPAELIVADNGSADNTAEIVRQFRPAHLEVKYISAPKRGQCEARNAGLAAAQGEVILFTDDDLRFPADWIESMCGPILRGEADAVAGGVTLAPHLKRKWMTPSHQDWLASTASISSETMVRLVGANMAFARRVLEKVPQFDTALGPGALGFEDDTLFTLQLMEAGFRVNLALDVCVEHHFEPSRLTRKNFVGSARKMGASSAYVFHHWQHEKAPMTLWMSLKSVLRLLLWWAYNVKSWREPEGMADREMVLLKQYWFLRQLRQEQKRPRAYSHLGTRLLKQEQE